jgi:hypothetical protein
MSNTVAAVFGISAGVINAIGLIPYVADIFRHKTKPERATWWVYSALYGLLFTAQMQSGAKWLLAVTGAYILSAVSIAILSLHFGYGSFHKRDTVSLLIAAVGLGLWKLTNQPLAAIVIVILVDAAGFWLTLIKTWHAPYSETLIGWQCAFAAACLSVFSIEKWSPSLFLFPVYSILGLALIIWMIPYRRRKVVKDIEDF